VSAPPISDRDWDKLVGSYDYVIWDFDGTLAHLRVDWPALKDRLARLIGGIEQDATMSAIAAEALKRGLHQRVWDMIAETELQGLRPLPARVEQLRRFAQRSAILTNNMSRTVEWFLASQRLPSMPIVSLDRVTLPKPDPEGIMRLAMHWRGRRALVIGDSELDRMVATSAGLDCVILPGEICDAG